MSAFDRIPPDHPLTEAARNVNTVSEERGLEATVDWLGLRVTTSQLAYLAEQRAIRACSAAWFQHNMGLNPMTDEAIARRVVTSPQWHRHQPLLIGCYMDGMAIGWKGHEIAQGDAG